MNNLALRLSSKERARVEEAIEILNSGRFSKTTLSKFKSPQRKNQPVCINGFIRMVLFERVEEIIEGAKK